MTMLDSLAQALCWHEYGEGCGACASAGKCTQPPSVGMLSTAQAALAHLAEPNQALVDAGAHELALGESYDQFDYTSREVWCAMVGAIIEGRA